MCAASHPPARGFRISAPGRGALMGFALILGTTGCATTNMLAQTATPALGAPLVCKAPARAVVTPSSDVGDTTKGPDGAPDSAAVSDDAHPAARGGIKTVLVSKFYKAVEQQAEVERGLDRTVANLPANGVLGVHFLEKVVGPDDDIITSTPHRAHYDSVHTEAHRWVNLRGVADVTNLGLSAPIGTGVVSASIGFTAGASLEYSVLRPYDLSPRGALSLPETINIDLLATRDQLRKFATIEGAQNGIKADGNFGVNGSINAGENGRFGPLDVSLSAGVEGSVIASGEISVVTLSLGDGRVFVQIGRTGDITANESAGINAGATLDDGAVSSVTSRLPQGALADWLTGKATDAVKSKVEAYLAFQASIGATQEHSTQRLAAFVLDVNTDGGADAAIALRRLDAGPAMRLAASGQSAHFVFAEDDGSHGNNANVQLGPWKLFLMNSLEKHRRGSLESNVSGNFGFAESLFQKERANILGSDTNITWDGTTYCENGVQQTFFHLTFDNKNRKTGDSDVHFFERAMEALGATLAEPVKTDAQGHGVFGFIPRLFDGRYGRAEESLDIYFTRPGLYKLEHATESQLEAAWSRSLQTMRGWREAPAFTIENPDHALANQYLDLWQNALMRTGSMDEMQRLRDNLERQYGDRFHASLYNDVEARENMRQFIREVMGMRGQSEDQWIDVFARLGAKAQFHLWTHIGAITNLAGKDETLVHQMGWKGKGVTMTAKDGAYIPGIDEKIGPLMAPP